VSVRRSPQETLIFAPVAGDSDFHDFWSVPASELGLTCLAQVYDNGLQVSGDDDLNRLEQEVWALQKYWARSVPDGDFRHYDKDGRKVDVPLFAHLAHRAESVLTAIEVAKGVDGVLTSS
jgi:hypothetical protein